jgi:hypothetical protein
MRTHLNIEYEKLIVIISFGMDIQYCTIICVIVSSHCAILYNILLLLVLIISVTLSTKETEIPTWISTVYGKYDI